MIDFTVFYKSLLPNTLVWGKDRHWDLFISAYNSSERVRRVYESVTASSKQWIICPEYHYNSSELPMHDIYVNNAQNEADFINDYVNAIVGIKQKRICIDITGFIRPHLLFLLQKLVELNVPSFDALYSEPVHYREKEATQFSKDGIREVRQIAKYEGIHLPDTSNDVLIIGAGYDSSLISSVAEAKDHSRKIQLLGFPSLRADMFQENMLRVQLAEDALGESETFFAPAHDPFVTAETIKNIVSDIGKRKPITNLYLSPLSTKAQVLGFALYYIACCNNNAASIIYPISDSYERETATGVSRVWQYTVDLNALRTAPGNTHA